MIYYSFYYVFIVFTIVFTMSFYSFTHDDLYGLDAPNPNKMALRPAKIIKFLKE